MKLIILLLTTIYGISCQTEFIKGCSSHCSPLFDENLGCFNKTLNFYEKALFGVMRNYISSQVNVIKTRKNNLAYTRNDLIEQALSAMRTENPSNDEDEGDVLSVDQARPIVEALVDNVLSTPTTQFLPAECPHGCESKRSPFDIILYISLGINGFLFIVGLSSLFLRTRNDNRVSQLKTEVMVTKEELKAYKLMRKEKKNAD